jgi:hypothetical protein
MAEEKSYVYIDAPSLDNADRCKFILNKDFQYVQAGESGNVAEFPLYDKFQGKGDYFTSLSMPGISRTNIIDGIVDTSNDTEGGDYKNANVCKVYSRIFKVGRVKKLIFKLFSITGNTISPLSDYSTVPTVAIFITRFKDDGTVDVNNLDFITYARYKEKSQDGYGIYEVEGEFAVSGKALTTPLCGFCFVFLNATALKSDNHFNNVSFGTLASQYCSFKPGLRMVPRGSIDNVSYICYNTSLTTRSDGEKRILDFDFEEDVELVDEYIGTNSSNHHLDSSEFRDLNGLRYTAPAFMPDNAYTKLIGATGWVINNVKDDLLNGKGHVKISDNTLTRNKRFTLTGKSVFAIKIPLQYSTELNDFINSGIRGGYTDGAHGLINTNRRIIISLDCDENGNPINWVQADDYLSVSYFKDYITYEATFKNVSNKEHLRYKDKGIYIAAIPVKFSNGSFENGSYNLPFYCWRNSSGKYWQYTPNEDYAVITDYSKATGVTKTNMTAGIKVVFDYDSRAEWFDYIESLILNHTS